MNSKHDDVTGEDDDWLDALLIASRPEPIEDDGFSLQVMQKLESQLRAQQVQKTMTRKVSRDKRMEIFSVAGMLVGTTIAVLIGALPDLAQVGMAIDALASFKLAGSTALLPFLAMLFSIGVAAWSIRND